MDVLGRRVDAERGGEAARRAREAGRSGAQVAASMRETVARVIGIERGRLAIEGVGDGR